jgi:sugar/nucleoside kinase (ribokinase family)
MEPIPEGKPVAHKHPVTFVERLGGPGANGVPVARANGLHPHLIAVQSREDADRCRRLARACGLTPDIIERGDPDDRALTLGLPNGQPGARDLLVQRCKPIRLVELARYLDLLGAANALLVGPIPVEGDDPQTVDLLKRLPGLAPRADCALAPHATLPGHHRFGEIASRYDSVHMNLREAEQLPVSGPRADRVAYLRRLLGEDTDIAITNGPDPGLLWSDRHEWPIHPVPIQVVSEVGAGDAFCTAWTIARALFRADAATALHYAAHAVAAVISRSGTVAPLQRGPSRSIVLRIMPCLHYRGAGTAPPAATELARVRPRMRCGDTLSVRWRSSGAAGGSAW